MEPRRTNPVAVPSPAEAPLAAAPANGGGQAERFDLLLRRKEAGEPAKTTHRAGWQRSPETQNDAVSEPLNGTPLPPDDVVDEVALQSLSGSVTAATVQVLLLEVPLVENPLVAAATGEAFADAGMPPQGHLVGAVKADGAPPREIEVHSHAELTGETDPAAIAAPPPVIDPALAPAALSDNSGAAGLERNTAKTSPRADHGEAASLQRRVVRALAAAEQHDGEIRLRLRPPELGSLRLELQIKGDALVARIQAETASARTVLMDNLPILRERLGEQGLRIERFDVELMQHQTGDQPHAPPDGERLPPTAQRQPAAQAAPAPDPAAARSPFPRRKRGRLNVIV